MSDLLPIVTIDGPSGVGKSTAAGLLAKKLDIPHLDTGAMFRYSAMILGDKAKDMSAAEVSAVLSGLDFDLAGKGADARLQCNGKPIGDEIRTEQVALLASQIAQRPEVREFMLQSERKIGARHALIADGRDTGTVVFPDAAFKIFLKGSAKTRAMRRLRDLEKLGVKADLASLESEMAKRDDQDRERALAPLKPANDAKIVDTSNLGISEVLDTIIGYIKAREKETGITLS